jgi:hypothetical protein
MPAGVPGRSADLRISRSRVGRRVHFEVLSRVQEILPGNSISTKGAVDNDLVHSSLNQGELLIIELRYEQLRDTARVGRRGL